MVWLLPVLPTMISSHDVKWPGSEQGLLSHGRWMLGLAILSKPASPRTELAAQFDWDLKADEVLMFDQMESNHLFPQILMYIF